MILRTAFNTMASTVVPSALSTTSLIATSSAVGGPGAALVDLAGQLAPMASMLIFFSPYPTLQQVSRNRSTGSLPILPYTTMIISCLLWTAYGALKGSSTIWMTNGIGVAFGLYYFLKFARFAPKESNESLPGSILQHVNAITLMSVSTLLLASGRIIPSPEHIVGLLSVAFCIGLFASPLASIKTVMETKSAESIALPFSIASTINCILWSIVGVFSLKDMNVILPNMMGLTFSLIQILCKFVYGNGKQYGFAKDMPL